MHISTVSSTKETIGKNSNEKRIQALKQRNPGNEMLYHHTVLHTKNSCMTSFELLTYAMTLFTNVTFSGTGS